MIQERSILKVVPQVFERRSRELELRGSRLSAIQAWFKNRISKTSGIAQLYTLNFSRTVAGRTRLSTSTK